MSEEKKTPSQEGEGMKCPNEYVAVIVPGKSFELVPVEKRKVACSNTFKEILKILAKNKCTVKETQKILRFVGEHIETVSESMTVQNTSKLFKDEDLNDLFY